MTKQDPHSDSQAFVSKAQEEAAAGTAGQQRCPRTPALGPPSALQRGSLTAAGTLRRRDLGARPGLLGTAEMLLYN